MRNLMRFFLLVLLINNNLIAWGYIAHMAVGEVASIHLTDKARSAVHDILNGSGYNSLKEIAPVPDHNRGLHTKFPWIKCDINHENCQDVEIVWYDAPAFHFLNIADILWDKENKKWKTLQSEKQIIDFAKDLENKCDGDRHCAHDAYNETINAMTILKDKDRSSEQKRVALIWLTHLVGDLSQPLHLGRTSDRGGNDIVIRYHGKKIGTSSRGRKEKLHYMWDTGLIKDNKLTVDDLSHGVHEEYNGCSHYESDINDDYNHDKNNLNLFNYIHDNANLLQFAYDNLPSSRNIGKFDERVISVIKKQIYSGGIFLSNILNDIFDPQ